MRHLAKWQLFCWGIGLLCSAPGHSRAEEPAAPYIAQTWTSDDGLPATEVSALLQSRDGYLWIGTPGGLTRFDGERFVTLRKSEAPGLTSNRILCLCNDGQGGIWVGTDGGGLTHYAPERPELTPRVRGLSSLTVLAVQVDERGDLWAGSDAGLNRWEANRFVPYLKVDGLPDETVTTIARGSGGGLLIGTGAGLGQFTGGNFQPFSPVPGLPSDRVSALAVEANGIVWIGSQAGLDRVERLGQRTDVRHIPADGVVSILSRANGEMWFGTSDGSLQYVPAGRGEPVKVRKFRSAPTALLEDHEGSVWAGTGQGLTRFRKRQLLLRSSPAGQDVVSYYSSEAGVGARVFKDGTADFGVGGREPGTNWFPANVLAKVADGFGRGLWVGTSGEGLWRWDGQTRKVWGQPDGLSDIFVEALYAAGPNSVWVGTRNGGLNHITDAGVRRYLTPWGYTGNYASAIAADPAGAVWIGTTGDGLFSLREGIFSAHNVRSGLPDNRITSVIAESDGTVWAGTARGLALWQGGRWRAFFARNGVPEETIDQMQDDAYDHLWLGCGPAIYRYSRSDLRGVAAGARTVVHGVPYGRSDGLAGASMIQGAQMSRNSRRDEVVFSTTRGLLVFEPGRLALNTNPPPVLIEEALIGSEAVLPARTIEAPPGQRTVQFRYTALSFVAPEKVRFRCRLSGFDTDWVDVGGSRTMRYTRVPPGAYRFQVVACNNDGLWNQTGAEMGLVVAPFWWETAWFRFGAGVCTAAALAGIVRLRQQRRREIERLRLRLAGDLHDEIGSSLWSITLLSKMLQQGPSLAEEDRRDAGEIHRIATQTSNALRDIVWLINPGLDTVQDMVMRMRDFLSATVRNLDVQVQAEHADLSRKLSLELRLSFFLAFKEAVTNVAKHANAKRLEVILAETKGVLEMRVKDDGVGFDPARPRRGHGLRSLQRRAQTVRGELVIESRAGEGTEVILRAGAGIV